MKQLLNNKTFLIVLGLTFYLSGCAYTAIPSSKEDCVEALEKCENTTLNQIIQDGSKHDELINFYENNSLDEGTTCKTAYQSCLQSL